LMLEACSCLLIALGYVLPFSLPAACGPRNDAQTIAVRMALCAAACAWACAACMRCLALSGWVPLQRAPRRRTQAPQTGGAWPAAGRTCQLAASLAATLRCCRLASAATTRSRCACAP